MVRIAVGVELFHRRIEMTVSTAPPYQKCISILLAGYGQSRNIVGYLGNLATARLYHQGVVGTVVGDDGCIEIFLKAAYTVHRSPHPGDSPCTGEILALALVGTPVGG